MRDICASFQAAAAGCLSDRFRAAASRYSPGLAKRFVVAGGVASNAVLRSVLMQECEAAGFSFHAPPPSFCTDNAAMIAWAGSLRLTGGYADALDVPARARWPLADTYPTLAIKSQLAAAKVELPCGDARS